MGTSEEMARVVVSQKPPSWVEHALPSEQPQHEVRVTSGYWIDRYEVTNAAFQAFVDAGGYAQQTYWSAAGWTWRQERKPAPACADSAARKQPLLPCVKVSWYEADAYARWRGGRLPTEAEWEYAARGPAASIYPWGDRFESSRANVLDSRGLTPVGSYPAGASWVGAHDMAGNAMEWVADWLDAAYYAKSPHDDPPGPPGGRVKVEKGGWWGSNPFVARSAYRHFEDPPEYADGHIGFRVLSPAQP
jgi:formylglycine-generating enzyme required for sulfatase activity